MGLDGYQKCELGRAPESFYLAKIFHLFNEGSKTVSDLFSLKEEILKLIQEYSCQAFKASEFKPGTTPVPPSGKVIDGAEIGFMVEAALDGWLTTGRFNEKFEEKLEEFLGVKYVLTTNSGSSANLLAFSALCSPALGDRAIKPGDEVITVAAGFPTTVNPILQNNATPVFVDVSLPTYNVDVDKIEAAITPRTKAMVFAHTLGNPFNLSVVRTLCDKHHLWLLEDCCDALGSRYRDQVVGTFGDIGTLSFYPAHHITMGEGGAVFTANPELKKILESIRDWGRDCFCPPGRDNTCRKRFQWQLGDLPFGYDHKYTYSNLGYNLKITDMQAACALGQMDKLSSFIMARKKNFRYLKERLAPLDDYFLLPEVTKDSDPAWFGFPITIRKSAHFDRVSLLNDLDRNKIGTRLLFAGNLTRQPYMKDRPFRIVGTMENTDTIMSQTFWIGVYPGLSEEMLEYVVQKLKAFVMRKS